MSNSEEPRQAPVSRFWSLLFVLSAVLLVVVLAFGAGLLTERTLVNGGTLFERGAGPGSGADPNGAATDGAFPQLAEVKRLLAGEFFYRPTEPNAVATFAAELDRDALAGMERAAATPAASIAGYRQQLEIAGIHGMTSGLEDPFTVYLEPAVQAPIAESLRGEYEGIGVVVNQPEGQLTIVSVFPSSPAAEAGLAPGDVILAADGTDLAGLDSPAALALIRGPEGTSVQLKIGRDEAEDFEVELERRAIETPAVTYEAVGNGTIGWIRIGIFGDKTTAQLDAAITQAAADGVGGLVLDLRGNGGGWVLSAQEVLGRFVPAEAGPALLEDHAPGEADALEAKPIINGDGEVVDLPVAVLVDGGTASAAEIVAGALRHYGRGSVIGTPTFGKGSVQRVHDFADGSSARITSARWLTPDGVPIPEAGLDPDIVAEAATDPAAGDPQLEVAIRLLRGEPPLATPQSSPVATPTVRRGSLRI